MTNASNAATLSHVHPAKPIQAFIESMATLLSSCHASAFCRTAESVRATKFAKTWLGINFVDVNLVSVKLYFTMYEPMSRETVSRLVGIPFITDQCLHLMAESEACLDPDIIGSGYTICLKLSPAGGVALGFHVRQGNAAVYRHFTDQTWYDKQYHYVNDREQIGVLADKLGVSFLRDCAAMELGGGPSHGLTQTADFVKVVPVGSFADLSYRLYTGVEQQVIAAAEDRFSLIATSGGIYCPPILKSVYFAPRERVRTFSAFMS